MTSDNTEALKQPLSQPVPDRIWLLDLGCGDIVWSAERDPDGEQVDAVEYVRYTPPTDAGLADELESKLNARHAARTEAAADTFTHEIGLLVAGHPETFLAALRHTPTPVENEREALAYQIAQAKGHLANIRAHGNAEANACLVIERALDMALTRPSPAQVGDGGEK